MKKLHISQYWLGLAAGGLLALAVFLGATFRLTGIRTAQAAVEGQAVVQGELAGAPVIHYQGRLLVPGTGQAKPDGNYQMIFSIYNVDAGGAPLWTETKSVAVSRGGFNTLLGDITPLNLGNFDGQDLYLGVTVGADPEATPRQRLAHVAYAIHAENATAATTAGSAATAGNADTLDGQDSTAFAASAHSHTQFAMLPIAYAHINANGTKASGTANVTSLWDGTRYQITIAGEAYFWLSYVTVVTTTCNNTMARTDSLSNNLLVIITNTSGTAQIQCNFQFVTFKP